MLNVTLDLDAASIVADSIAALPLAGHCLALTTSLVAAHENERDKERIAALELELDTLRQTASENKELKTSIECLQDELTGEKDARAKEQQSRTAKSKTLEDALMAKTDESYYCDYEEKETHQRKEAPLTQADSYLNLEGFVIGPSSSGDLFDDPL
uniref:Uncharacterized protein n=1 Tax=Cannabis sativa TaxID=3483 RepID=A0A803NHX8_CANSA